MATIGVRELKNQATEILREVRERQVEYIVTHRGRAIAKLSPLTEHQSPTAEKDEDRLSATVHESLEAAKADAQTQKQGKPTTNWAEMDWLRQEIARQWKTNLTAVEAVAEQRR